MPKDVTNEEKQTTPDLDQIMMEGHPAFDGTMPQDDETAAPTMIVHPGPGAKKDDTEDGAAEDEAAAAAAQAAQKAEEEAAAAAAAKKTEDEEAAAAAAAEAAQKAEEEAAAAAKAKGEKRFKDHDAAEQGYKDLLGRTTRAEQRNKELEAELTRINAEKTEAATREQQRQESLAFAKERNAQALEELDALDPDDAEYRVKAADVWARANVDIAEHMQARGFQPAPSPDSEKPTGDPPESPAGAEATDSKEAARTTVKEWLTAQALDPDDELFWIYASHAPSRDAQGQPLDLLQQAQWALDKSQAYSTQLLAKRDAAAEAAAKEKGRQHQETHLPLGRTGTGKTGPGAASTKETVQPVSLSDAIDDAMEQRRL